MKTAIVLKLFLRLSVAVALLGAVFVPVAMRAEQKELTARLFQRYDQKQLNVVHDGIKLTALNGNSGIQTSYAINYDHIHSAIPQSSWPKKLLDRYHHRNLLDEYTTEEVESSASFTDTMASGEMVRARKFYVHMDATGAMIDLYLVALDGKRVARIQEIYRDGSGGMLHPVDFGFHFRFYIRAPRTESDDDNLKVISEVIGQYLVPTDEYIQQNKAAVAEAEAKKNVTIQPGMSKDEVIKVLGEPAKSVTFGEKTLLKYADLTVELQGGKVVDVKTN